MGAPRLARADRRGFPRSLDGAPFLLPRGDSALRRSMVRGFEAGGLRGRVVGGFEDAALLMAVAQAGAGLFPTLSPIEAEIRRQYDVQVVGRLSAVRVQFYMITGGKALEHPAVAAVSLAARRRLFAASKRGDASETPS
jgi:LysR family transcriptional activator of nhaA